MEPTMSSPRLFHKHLLRTDSINGLATATSENRIPSRSVTFRRTCPAHKTSTTTAPGVRTATTVLSGTRRKSHRIGPPTATAIGVMSDRGAGRGSTMRRGALLHFTMDAGDSSATAGAGTPARDLACRSMVQHSSVSLAEASDLLEV